MLTKFKIYVIIIKIYISKRRIFVFTFDTTQKKFQNQYQTLNKEMIG